MEEILASLGGELCYPSRGDLRFAPFGGRPLIPSGETLAALEKTLNHIRETLAPLGEELCSPWGDICTLRGRPLLPSGGGLCSPSCSVEAGMVSLPHSCRVIRRRTLPGCDMEPGLAFEARKQGNAVPVHKNEVSGTFPGQIIRGSGRVKPHSCR